MPFLHRNDRPSRMGWKDASPTIAKLVLLLAGVVLFGWLFGIEALTRWHSGWASTTPYTAAGFALSGLALVLLPGGGRGRQIAVGLALALLGASLLVMGDHLFGWSSGEVRSGRIEPFLDQSGADRWMSFGTAVGFLNAAIAILLARRSDSRFFWASTGFGGIVALTGFMVVSGYVFSAEALYELEVFSTIALPTAFGFIFLGVALLSISTTGQFSAIVEQDKIYPLFFRGIVPIVLGLPLLVGWSILVAEQHGFMRFELGVAFGGAFYAAAIGALVWLAADRMEVTTRKRNEFAQKLRESEQWAREMVAALPQLVWTCRADGSCDFVGEQWMEYCGGQREEHCRAGWLARVHPEDQLTSEEAWRKSLKEGNDMVIECRIERVDGIYRWFHVTAKALHDQSGNTIRWFGSCTDVDDMKLASEVITESRDELEQRVKQRTREIDERNLELGVLASSLKEAQSLAKLGSWTLELESGAATWSDQLYRMFGIGPEESPPNYNDQSQLFAPASWETLTAAITRTIETGEGYRLTLNIITRQGEDRWIVTESKATKDESGKVVRLAGTCTDITESYFVQRELESLSLRLKLAVESANMGVWEWDISHDELSWDEAMHELYGHAGPVDYSVWRKALLPDDLEAAEQALNDALDGTRAFDHRFRIFGAQGKIKHLRGRSIVVRDTSGNPTHMIGVNQDVTSEWEAVQKLEKSEALTREFVTHAPAAIAMLDRDLNYLQVSDQWCRDFGVSKSDVAELTHLELGSLQPKIWDSIIPKVLEGSLHAPTETQLFDAKGHPIWLQWEMRPWRQESGDVGGILISSQFTTERKELELRLRERERELERSNRDLEQFAYVASHDLQEPLRAVSGCVQLLQNRYGAQLDEQAGALINHTVAGAKRMQELIHDLLVYSRIGSQTEPLAEVDLRESLDLALSNLSEVIAESNLEIEVKCNFPTLKIDRIQIASLFQNLMSNAIKYRSASRLPKVSFSAIEDKMTWTCIVRDNGMGIDERHWERVFKIFQRLHTRSEIPGSGIGLSICAKIAEGHNGRIWIEESSTEGTEFRFNLPKAKGT